MPDWKLHLIFGCFLAIIWFNILYFSGLRIAPTNVAALTAITLFISLLPDIDLSRSKTRKLVSSVLAFFISLIYILSYPLRWFYGILYFLVLYFLFVNLPTKHRGITHSFKFSFLFSIMLSVIFYLALNLELLEVLFWFNVIAISYLLHLVLDKL